MVCDYGCGKEAKYQFKNGKWCCSDNHQKCDNSKKKHLGRNNYMFGKLGKDNPNYGRVHTNEAKSKISKTHKGKTVSQETRKKLSKSKMGHKFSQETRKKLSKSKMGHKVSQSTKNKISIANSGNNHNKKIRKLISISRKYKIEDYKKYHITFSKIEEMRYNPDKPGEKEIQVHCKNHLCKNSKEKMGGLLQQKHNYMKELEVLN